MVPLNRHFAQTISGGILTAMLLSLCSCATMDSRMARAQNDPFADDVLASASSKTVRRAAYDEAVGAKPSSIQLAGGQRIEFCPPDDRVPLSSIDATGTVPAAQLARDFPDEYLFDGGDRALPVHYDDFNMLGFDSEDTLAEYRDDEGNRHVKPSTRVAVYAPRFGSVTTISGPSEGVAINRLSDARMAMQGTGLRGRQTVIDQAQRESTERLVTRLRGSAVFTDNSQHEMLQPISIAGHASADVSFQDYAFLQTGRVHRAEEAQLNLGIQSAEIWTRTQYPVITAQDQSAGELTSRFTASEFAGLEPKIVKIGRLRIVKLADKQTAEPGDIITFTIRYDNLGDREVRNVVLLDNLTPRLEYVNDSATSDHDGQLTTVDNGEGSLILRWELDNPLPGRQGGVVTFQARVK